MKKNLIMLVLAMVMVAFGIPCCADAAEYQVDELQNCEQDYTEISGLTDEIYAWIADYVQVLGKGELSDSVDLDVGVAKRIYVGADELLTTEDLSAENI